MAWAPAGRLAVVTREGCHLCVVALETVRRVAAEHDLDVEVVDVDRDPELLARYSEEVPVTFVDGAQHDYWRVEETRLRAALERS